MHCGCLRHAWPLLIQLAFITGSTVICSQALLSRRDVCCVQLADCSLALTVWFALCPFAVVRAETMKTQIQIPWSSIDLGFSLSKQALVFSLNDIFYYNKNAHVHCTFFTSPIPREYRISACIHCVCTDDLQNGKWKHSPR